MPDTNRPIDPNLLRLMQGRLGRPPTVGAGSLDKLGVLRALNMANPTFMGGGLSKMPQGAIKPILPDNVVQGEFGPGELQTLNAPNINKPLPGGNLDPTKAMRTPWMNANDKQNILKQRLDNMRATQRDDAWKYQDALMEQRERIKSQQPEKPIFTKPATVSPLSPNIKPRNPLNIKQIYGAANKLDTLGNKEDAVKARQYNFLTEQFRDKIKDYQLAQTDLDAWVKKNAVPDFDAGVEEWGKLNKMFEKVKQPTISYKDYKDLKRYELQGKMRKQGVDNFYNELKSNLTSMHNELDRLHKLIEQNSGE